MDAEWTPLALYQAAALFRDASFRWWASGGHALELHLGTSWRSHGDTDIGICRRDVSQLAETLKGWDIHVAAAGVLTPWDGRPLDDARSENNLWCRSDPDSAWALDVTIGDGDDHEWIYRRDRSIRRPWGDAVLADERGVPYLAPEIQLLFKSKAPRPKDDVDAEHVIPRLDPERRTWLAEHLTADHPWQRIIASTRASIAIGDTSDDIVPLDAGRSSHAFRIGDRVVRVPIPNSGRLLSYRSEALIGQLLSEREHPVATWELAAADGVDCSVGSFVPGEPIPVGWEWSNRFIEQLARVLRDLHQLPAAGWGPLEDRDDQLRGRSGSPTDGVVERWFHAHVWPFDGSDLSDHPIVERDLSLLEPLHRHRAAILDAASEPHGIVHSDLHRQHLLHTDGELSGLLDFGDAFIGSTAWDFALLAWYYDSDVARRVATAYGDDDLVRRGQLLTLTVGCYKFAKTPTDASVLPRLRAALDALA